MTQTSVRCRLLGQSEIQTRTVTLTPDSELHFGLALYFCAKAGIAVPRDEVVRLFWPDKGDAERRQRLRQALYRLKAIGIAVNDNAKSCMLDSGALEADYRDVSDVSPASAFTRLLDVAIAPGYSPRFSRAFAQWLETFRADLGAQIRRGLVRAIALYRTRGRYGEVERLCKLCLRLDPLNEEATLALAESVAIAGGKIEALRLVDRYAREVGREQSELAIPARILRQRISDRLSQQNDLPVEVPLTGRGNDVERILTVFQQLRGNEAASYAVRGIAGVGKTRLALECCRIMQIQGARLVSIGTQPSNRSQPLFAVSGLVDELLRLPGSVGAAPAALECLREISSATTARQSSIALDADVEGQLAMVRWSILEVLDAVLSEVPLVIFVDDAHHLDAASLAILQDALRTHRQKALMLLYTMRPFGPAEIETCKAIVEVSVVHELLPLSDEYCDRLVQRFCDLKEEPLGRSSRDRIIQLSGGNPLFLLELLKHRAALAADTLPLSVQALLENRLAHLSDNATAVLRAIAVLGLSATVERLHRVVGPSRDLMTALSELHNAGLLSSKDGGVLCRHDTVRDVVLALTPPAVLVLLHHKAARSLSREAVRGGSVALLWEFVHHWRKGGSTKDEARIAFVLAVRLMRIGLANESLNLLEDLERIASSPTLTKRVLANQARAARILRDWNKVVVAVGKWIELCKSLGVSSAHSSLEVLLHEAMYYSKETFGWLPKSIEECVQTTSAPTRHRLATATLSMIRADAEGDVDSASRIFDVVSRLEPTTRFQRIDSLTVSAIYHTAFGDLDRVQETLQKLTHEALRIRHPALRARYVRRACFGLARYGDANKARKLLVQCLETFEHLRIANQSALCVEDLGTLSLWSDPPGETPFWFDKAHALHEQYGDPYSRAVEFELRTLFAFQLDCACHLPSFQMPADVEAALARASRTRQFVFALRVMNCVLSKRTDSELDQAVSRLEGLHTSLRNCGYQDFAVAALAAGLVHQHRIPEASETLAEYLNHSRRELRNPWPPLLREAKRLGLSQAVAARSSEANITAVPHSYPKAADRITDLNTLTAGM